jgi:putative pyruvate formate lyase activating enzyme
MPLDQIKIASATLHFGEEPFISGAKGSGTIFFFGCLLHCVYCQNYQISQGLIGNNVTSDQLAQIMLSLQEQGAHNINLVSPTHYASSIIEALKIAKAQGLVLPIVYNTGGYDTLPVLEKLEGLVDVYLPDLKYSDNMLAIKYSAAPRYVEINRAALWEMFRQVGLLEVDEAGVARKGLVVRHLVLPNSLAGSFASLDFLASISKDITISLMAQYHPCYKASEYREINRRLLPAEYQEVVDYAVNLGFSHVLTQELSSSDKYLPDFKKTEPFLT